MFDFAKKNCLRFANSEPFVKFSFSNFLLKKWDYWSCPALLSIDEMIWTLENYKKANYYWPLVDILCFS